MPSSPLSRVLNANPHVILSPRGVDQFGIYLEFVQVAGHMKDRISEYTRMLVIDRNVYAYQRDPAKSRTVWRRTRILPTAEDARKWIEKHFETGQRILCGSMILVQLEPSDLKQVADGQVPGARYRGLNHFRRLFGDFDGSAGTTAQVNVPMSEINIDRALKLLAPPEPALKPITPLIVSVVPPPSSPPWSPPPSSVGWTPTVSTPTPAETVAEMHATGAIPPTTRIREMLDDMMDDVEKTVDDAKKEYGEEPY